MDELRRAYIKKEVTIFSKCGSVNGGSTLKQILQSTIMSRQFFLTKDLCLLILYLKKKNGSLFGYVQCDLIVPDELMTIFSIFPPIFKNIDVCRNDIGEYVKNYAEENDLLKSHNEC